MWRYITRFIGVSFGIISGSAYASDSSSASQGRVMAQDASSTMCPANYQPVCAVAKDGRKQTYTNSCEAQKAGAIVFTPGRCEDNQ
jgi:hypothetical protein